jgi:hypothetical protein
MDFCKDTNAMMTRENDYMNCRHKISDLRSNRANVEDSLNEGNTPHSHLTQPTRCTMKHSRFAMEISER